MKTKVCDLGDALRKFVRVEFTCFNMCTHCVKLESKELTEAARQACFRPDKFNIELVADVLKTSGVQHGELLTI